ncbi:MULTISPECIES: NFACT family protein [Peptoniphilus]|uniref:Rqc2 family fibronectin-binding protein n=1 Tax=Peptoniphilus TaxID=162289 RepID=UPI0008DB1E49|nr:MULTISPECIES: NFACT RNA binding domain-containing protein [Peptoniphilus]MDU1043503.1 NFACT RNA binding domain-containing protein [Peptoniphilus rhinitidis]MDU1954218.1 NFACT RNA binding domain-containing protein [Peptoniphilus lacydonensis]MDU3751619.1 NFACT RNA binding domain-containing protein [Peptoniphilus rhinitidis]MDU5595649.1 NFACT RNA binding domain-containing protein [Peptoniphilus rhinitidis]
MSLDGTVIKNLVYEIKNEIVNGRIDKIYQKNNDLLINIRAHGEKKRLFISLSGSPRMYFSNELFDSPQNPPAFCMLLRKHLENNQIISVCQYKMDRIIKILVKSKDELGEFSEKALVIELMGKHSNVILIDNDSKKIIDSLIRVNFNVSRVREILPGLFYNPEDISNGFDPTKTENIANVITKSEKNLNLKSFFIKSFTGISPQMCTEIESRCYIDFKRTLASLSENEIINIDNTFLQIFREVKNNNFTPIKIYRDGIFKDFYSIDLESISAKDKIKVDSISSLLEEFYNSKFLRDSLGSKSSELRKSINKQINKLSKKVSNQSNELNIALNREQFKVYADLLSSNFHKIKKGDNSVVVENFYNEMESIEIPLDPKLDGPSNASKYYKKYSKLKNAAIFLNEQIEMGNSEINYLKSILLNIDFAQTPDEIDELYEELEKSGYLKKKNKNKKNKKKDSKENYIKIKTDDGFDIYIGKNNIQNDYLTLKKANKNDLWFHVKDAPGSHVILKNDNREFSNKALLSAAKLAAKYSSLSKSQNIPVDYTFKMNVKRHPAKKPGLVTYTSYKTININL